MTSPSFQFFTFLGLANAALSGSISPSRSSSFSTSTTSSTAPIASSSQCSQSYATCDGTILADKSLLLCCDRPTAAIGAGIIPDTTGCVPNTLRGLTCGGCPAGKLPFCCAVDAPGNPVLYTRTLCLSERLLMSEDSFD